MQVSKKSNEVVSDKRYLDAHIVNIKQSWWPKILIFILIPHQIIIRIH